VGWTDRWLGIFLAVTLLGLACAPGSAPAAAPPAKPATAPPAPAGNAPTVPAVPTQAIPTAAQAPDAPLNPPVKVRAGVTGTIGDAGVFIAQEQGYFRGQGLDVDLNVFQSAQQTIPLLGSGQLDTATGGASAGLMNAAGQDIPIRIAAGTSTMYPGFRSQGYVVRKDLVDSGSFQGCPSFRGLRVANAADGNTGQIVFAHLLRGCGLALADTESVLMTFGDMLPAFRNRAIDAAFMIEPGLTVGTEEGYFTLYKSSDEVYPNQQGGVLLYSPQFIANQQPAAQRFMVAYLQGVRDYNDAFVKNINKADIVAILARTTSLKDPALIERMAPVGLNPDGYANTEALASDIQWWLDNGYVKNRVDVAQVVDNTFVDYAVARLGRYAAP
jgi:ABC-type nitrate/sulfonate/bicarbonate transport system substrate-binding protein